MMEGSNMSFESPSPTEDVRLAKRQRCDTPSSSGYHSSGRTSALGTESDIKRLQRELAALRRQLTQMEDTVSQHVEIREKMMKVSENEKDMLKTQLHEAQETIEELQEELNIARCGQAAAEAELHHTRARMQLEMALLMENANMRGNAIDSNFQAPLASSELEGVDPEIQRYIKTEEELILNNDDNYDDNSSWQMEINTENITVASTRSITPTPSSEMLTCEGGETKRLEDNMVHSIPERSLQPSDLGTGEDSEEIQKHVESVEGIESQKNEDAISHLPSRRQSLPGNIESRVTTPKQDVNVLTCKGRDALEANKKRVKELAEELRLAKEMLKNPEQVSTSQKEMNTSERNSPRFVKANRKITDLFSTHKGSSSGSGTSSEALQQRISQPQTASAKGDAGKPSPGDEEISSWKTPKRGESRDTIDIRDDSPADRRNHKDPTKKGMQRGDKLKLVDLGKYYCYLVSERFFEIDWDDEYGRENDMFSCRTCGKPLPSRARMEEHVWVKHYQGKFFCPHCPQHSGGLAMRPNLAAHSKIKHPALYDSEAFKENIQNVCRILK